MNWIFPIAEAMTTPVGAGEGSPTWAFWVTAVSIPMMFLAIGSIIWRLRRGEEKFDAQGIALATLATEVKHLETSCSKLADELAKANQRVNDGSVESASSMGELKAAIAREYTRRAEFDQERQRSDERFMQLLNLIGEVRSA